MSILYGFVIQHINADDNQFLADTLRAVSVDLAEKHSNSDRLLADEVPPGTTDYFVRVLDQQSKQVIAEQPAVGDRVSPSIFPAPLPDGGIPAEGVEYKSPSGHWYFLMSALSVLDADSPRPIIIQVAQDGSDEKAFMQNFSRLLLCVLIGGIICSATIAFFAARRALRPLEEIAAAAEKVQASQLHQRLGGGRWPSELTALAAGFDKTLARLEESFDRLSRFSADLAHELRMPIQNLRSESEVALTRPRTASEYREVIELSVEEYQRLSGMIDNLLFLARAENAETRLNRSKFKIGPVVDTILDFYDAAAREREISLTRKGDGELDADQMLFRRVINNVVSNALRHTSRSGQIQVSVVTGNQRRVEIRVQDNGCGIGPEHLPRIFDRFYRVDAARSADSASNGLGLAIVKSIMDLHGGSAQAESALGVGTTVTLSFPSD